MTLSSWDTILHIGFDDTDSLEGQCTTYLATLIIEEIADMVIFLDYPKLIRNNPNIPWKTRGNAAISLKLGVKQNHIQKIIEISKQKILKNHKTGPNTNPGLVYFTGDIPDAVKVFSKKTLVKLVSISEADYLCNKYNIKYFTIGNGRGIIGALSAIGNTLNPKYEDFTYEILTYRIPQYRGSQRNVVETSIKKMDKLLSPKVFNNIDEYSGKSIIAPAGKDPVLYGVRGETPNILLHALNMVKVKEPIERYCIFRTNQGTDQHFKYANTELKNYNVFKGNVTINSKGNIIEGGHVFLIGITNSNKRIIDLSAFEPTKDFRKPLLHLIKGDKIEAYGGVKYIEDKNRYAVQLEKCIILSLVDKYKEKAPICPKCQKRMTSNGYKKGYKCRKCGYKDRNLSKERIKLQRKDNTGLYIPPAGAQRHLVKPHRRYSLPQKNEIKLIKNWWKIY